MFCSFSGCFMDSLFMLGGSPCLAYTIDSRIFRRCSCNSCSILFIHEKIYFCRKKRENHFSISNKWEKMWNFKNSFACGRFSVIVSYFIIFLCLARFIHSSVGKYFCQDFFSVFYISNFCELSQSIRGIYLKGFAQCVASLDTLTIWLKKHITSTKLNDCLHSQFTREKFKFIIKDYEGSSMNIISRIADLNGIKFLSNLKSHPHHINIQRRLGLLSDHLR